MPQTGQLWCAEGNPVINLAYFSCVSSPWQHVEGTIMKMRLLMLFPMCLPCVWVCVYASVLKGQSSLSASQNFFIICIFICFRLDFASCSSPCLRIGFPSGLTRFCLVTESFVGNWNTLNDLRSFTKCMRKIPYIFLYLYTNIKQGMASHLFF